MSVIDGRRNNGPRNFPPAPAVERFWRHVDKREDGCWVWTARRYAEGYGQFNPGTGAVRAHQFAYTTLVGPVPAGLHLDHTCHSFDPGCPGGVCEHRACVNPAHLEPVTPLENTRRGRGHGKETHCPSSHPYDEANTYHYRGRRMCIACRDARNARTSQGPPHDDKHGQLSNYTRGCRCGDCRTAMRDYRRAYRARKAAEGAA